MSTGGRASVRPWLRSTGALAYQMRALERLLAQIEGIGEAKDYAARLADALDEYRAALALVAMR